MADGVVARVRRAMPEDLGLVQRMFQQLWPEHSVESLREDARLAVATDAAAPTLIAEDAEGEPLGFLQLCLRNYAEGCSSSPVAFVEGLWVVAALRRQGVARVLMDAAEEWARSQGCEEIASDTEVTNTLSQQVHAALGFELLPPLVPMRKWLK